MKTSILNYELEVYGVEISLHQLTIPKWKVEAAAWKLEHGMQLHSKCEVLGSEPVAMFELSIVWLIQTPRQHPSM